MCARHNYFSRDRRAYRSSSPLSPNSLTTQNFVTIRQALEVYSARQIRFCFVLHKYNDPMDYGDETMQQAVSIDRIFAEFFHNIKAVLRRLGTTGTQHVGQKEIALKETLAEARSEVRESLLDDFDTPRAIKLLMELIRETNCYVDKDGISSVACHDVARYVTSILRIFGLVQDGAEIGFPLESSAGEGASVSKEAVLSPFLDVLTKFRELVRLAAISGDTAAVLQVNAVAAAS